MSRPAIGRRDPSTGSWLIPVSDAWLDLLSKDWSRPVQLRAITYDGGSTYRFKVREPAGGDVVERIVELVTSRRLQDYRGDWNRPALRLELERVLTARG